MTSYLKKFYMLSYNMDDRARLVAVLFCMLPGIAVEPMKRVMATELAHNVLITELFNRANSIATPGQSMWLQDIGLQVFAPRPELVWLSYAVFGIAFVGFLVMTYLMVPALIKHFMKPHSTAPLTPAKSGTVRKA
ncbi:TPA: hypothetical protein ACVGJS_003631 [Pseudomonas aeruginosa]